MLALKIAKAVSDEFITHVTLKINQEAIVTQTAPGWT